MFVVSVPVFEFDFGVDSARKMRVNLPDSSSMVLQSFCQGNGKSKPSQPGQAAAQDGGRSYTSARRYSTTQEEAEDHFDSSEVLKKFTNSMAQSSAYIYTTHGGADKGLYQSLTRYSHEDKPGSSASSSPQTKGLLTRVQSSPHLIAPHGQLQVGRTDIESSVDADSGHQLARRQSHGDLMSLSRASSGGNDSGKDNNMPISKTSSNRLASEAQHPTDTDMTDNNFNNQSGFGILSRTRQFGTWLTKATDGEKVEVTKKDLNVFAPTSF